MQRKTRGRRTTSRYGHSLSAVGMRRSALLVAAAGVPLAWPIAAWAANDIFNNPNGGNWSTPSNWSLGFQPGNLDDATINGGGIFGSTVNYDAAATAFNLNILTLDWSRRTPRGLSQSLNTLSTYTEFVGFNQVGSLDLSGGSHLVTGSDGMYVGYHGTATGFVGLSGVGALSVASYEYVGYSGAGTINQSGGNNGAAHLALGWFSGSQGNSVRRHELPKQFFRPAIHRRRRWIQRHVQSQRRFAHQ
jgi:hypothetical protein